MERVIVLFVVVFVFGCTSNNYDYDKADQRMIALLVAKGSDTSKAHDISFFVDCRTKELVDGVIRAGVNLGLEDEYVSFSKKRNSWGGAFVVTSKLNAAEISEHRNKILPLMPERGCAPLGRGAGVVK